MQHVLIIDPETDFLEWAQRHLATDKVGVAIAPTAEEGLRKFLALKPDLVIAEFHLKPANGIDLLKRLRQQDPQVMVVLATAIPNPEDEAAHPEAAARLVLAAALASGEPAWPFIEALMAREALALHGDDPAAAAKALGLKPAAFRKLLPAPVEA